MAEGRFGGGPGAWGRIDVERVKGAAGLGFYELGLDVELTFQAPPPGAEEGWHGPVALSAEAWAGEEGSTGSRYVGHLDLREPLFILPGGWEPGFPAHLTARIALSGRQVEALEELRKGGNLAFRVDVRAVLLETTEPGPYQTHIVRDVSQSDWLRVLEQLGYQETLLLEIPVPNRSEFPAFSEAIRHLVEAQEAIARGGYREAVGLCSDALESLRDALGDLELEQGAWQKRSQDMKEMGKEERLLLVRTALWRVTSAARHPVAEWSRAEAISILAMVAALIRILVDVPGRPVANEG